MTSTKEGPRLLKSDTRGRVRTPRARQEAWLEEYAQSGLSGAKFAALVGIKYPTFAAWVLRRRQQGAPVHPSQPAPAQWLEAVVESAAPRAGSPAVRVRLPAGAWIELEHAGQAPLLAALLRAWEKAAPAC